MKTEREEASVRGDEERSQAKPLAARGGGGVSRRRHVGRGPWEVRPRNIGEEVDELIPPHLLTEGGDGAGWAERSTRVLSRGERGMSVARWEQVGFKSQLIDGKW